MRTNVLTPVLVLILWTFVIWFWMYATRLPAMRAAGIDPARIKRKDELDPLPLRVKQIADNYNHLHEQPTVFYALMLYTHLVGVADGLNLALGWTYVGLRIAHSLIQCTWNFVPVRFFVFSASSLVLLVIAVRDALALSSGT
jgi:hypothetical protein